jgi:lipopolysaccharide/colanic/teichoic acid biosynthesis glycosyltransferase
VPTRNESVTAVSDDPPVEEPARLTPAMRALKRLFDVAGAGCLLVLLSPAMLLIALVVRLASGRPVLFRQERTGLRGRRFTLYKFRTMIPGAEKRLPAIRSSSDVPGPVFKMRRDPRATDVGLLLRFFSLDELPQLFNVLRGEMSLVGPRPALPEEVARYLTWQRRRLSVTPGMTCTWQASGRSTIPFDRWVAMDLAYIENWSLVRDMVILLRTIPAVLFARGAW